MNSRATFPRSLRFWTLHVLLGASCSFCIAYTTDWRKPESMVGMVAGVLAFVVLYAVVWSSAWFRRHVPAGCALERMFVYGARFRSILGGLGMVGVLLPSLMHSPSTLFVKFFGAMMMPDLFSGMFATSAIGWFGRLPFLRDARILMTGTDPHVRAQNIFIGDSNSLIPTFAITLAQGCLLTLMLLGLGWLCLLAVAFNPWRKSRRQTPAENPAAALT